MADLADKLSLRRDEAAAVARRLARIDPMGCVPFILAGAEPMPPARPATPRRRRAPAGLDKAREVLL
jgi:hypothetical protein